MFEAARVMTLVLVELSRMEKPEPVPLTEPLSNQRFTLYPVAFVTAFHVNATLSAKAPSLAIKFVGPLVRATNPVFATLAAESPKLFEDFTV